jgi:hypothetical protein
MWNGQSTINTAAISYEIVVWRATADEDGHYSFAVAL